LSAGTEIEEEVMKFRTAKDITKEDIEWALDEAFKTVMAQIMKERDNARDTGTGGRVGD
jgi:hypothetical protein